MIRDNYIIFVYQYVNYIMHFCIIIKITYHLYLRNRDTLTQTQRIHRITINR